MPVCQHPGKPASEKPSSYSRATNRTFYTHKDDFYWHNTIDWQTPCPGFTGRSCRRQIEEQNLERNLALNEEVPEDILVDSNLHPGDPRHPNQQHEANLQRSERQLREGLERAVRRRQRRAEQGYDLFSDLGSDEEDSYAGVNPVQVDPDYVPGRVEGYSTEESDDDIIFVCSGSDSGAKRRRIK